MHQGLETAAQRWQQVEGLLHRALDLDDDEAGRALLRRECGSDAALLIEVSALLDAARSEASPLAGGVVLRKPDRLSVSVSGLRLGGWELREPIGRGGMGEVYRAERVDGDFIQSVAVKLLRVEAAAHLERFRAERRILARLEHSGIARIFDSGLAPDGRPYMIMEYVNGIPLIEHCRSRALDLRARLALFRQACDAVGYAHANLVIHRDLKSGNILVSEDGRVKLLDFGVAKLLDPAAWNEDMQTRTQQAPMTPGHAAPEQLRGEAVTIAADVYALGVVLYQLLAGRLPWRLQDLPLSVALHRLLVEEPLAASAAAEAGEAPPVPPRLLRGDLDAILVRALRKDPRERYATVDALSRDIDRHLAGDVVSAHRGGEWYRGRKFLRRNQLPITLAGLALAVAALFVWRVVQERDRAVAAEARAQREAQSAAQVSDYLVSLFEAAAPDRTGGKSIEPRRLVDEGRRNLDDKLRDQPQLHGRMLGTLGRLYFALGESEDAIVALKTALAEQAREPQADPVRTARLLNELGSAQYNVNKTREAGQSYGEALTLLQGQVPDTDADYLETLTLLGNVLAMHFDPPRGTAMLERAVALYEGTRLQSDQASALANLADAYRNGRREAEALKLARRALEIERRLNGDDHPGTLSVLKGYYSLLWDTGDWSQWEQVGVRALQLSIKLYGPDSYYANNTRYYQGIGLLAMGRIDEALGLLRQMERSERASAMLGTPAFALSLSQLGEAERVAGNLGRALALHREALAVFASNQAEDSRTALLSQALHARALIDAGDFRAAAETVRRELPATLTGVRNDRTRAQRLLVLALVAEASGDVAAAGKQADQVIGLLGDINSQTLAWIDAKLLQLRLLRRTDAARYPRERAALQAEWAARFSSGTPWLEQLRRQ